MTPISNKQNQTELTICKAPDFKSPIDVITDVDLFIRSWNMFILSTVRQYLVVSIILILSMVKVSRANQYDSHPSSHNYEGGKILKVFDFNTWGLGWPFAQDRVERFRALREVIRQSNYDIVLLQEVWIKADYNLLRTALPYFTYFEVFNGGCNGGLIPLGCSGLVILSRHPIVEVEFLPYTNRGHILNFDGEFLVHKGIGRARILWNSYTVDVFTTHLISYTKQTTNNYFRFTQAYEAVQLIGASNADIKIFGGDINAMPFLGEREPYRLLSDIMTDAMTEKFPGFSMDPFFATFGNKHNIFSSKEIPERIDVVMYSTLPGIHMKTIGFEMPLFMTKNSKGNVIGLSDHEAIEVTFLIKDYHHHQVKRNETDLS